MIVQPDIRGRGKTAASLSVLIFVLSAGAWSPLCPSGMAAPASPATETVPDSGNGSRQGRERIKAAQEKMLSDPETVKLIEELEKDPSIQEILRDKALLEAIERGDLSHVEDNPKMKALMNSPAFRKILEKNK